MVGQAVSSLPCAWLDVVESVWPECQASERLVGQTITSASISPIPASSRAKPLLPGGARDLAWGGCGSIRARSPFGALAPLACSGQALPRGCRPRLKPRVYLKTGAFGMTASELIVILDHSSMTFPGLATSARPGAPLTLEVIHSLLVTSALARATRFRRLSAYAPARIPGNTPECKLFIIRILPLTC